MILLSGVLRKKGIEILSKLERGDLCRPQNTELFRLLRLRRMDGTSWRRVFLLLRSMDFMVDLLMLQRLKFVSVLAFLEKLK